MRRLRERDAFRILLREFFAQLFTSESSVSEHQFRVGMISVLVFLIMPGFFIPLRLAETLEIAAIQSAPATPRSPTRAGREEDPHDREDISRSERWRQPVMITKNAAQRVFRGGLIECHPDADHPGATS